MPGSGERNERVCYLSWVDKRTDPWPNWERIRPGEEAVQLEQKRLEFLPENHPEWPGMPFVQDVHPLVVSDRTMGRYSWPGIPLSDGSGRLYVGPTLSALFHRGSHRNLRTLDRVFLLYQPDQMGSPHEELHKLIHAIARARGIKGCARRVQLHPISGISDPTDYKLIIDALRAWLQDDPFGLGSRSASRGERAPLRITVNLSPGTAAMSACWLILRWSGLLGRTHTTVEFVQGDGGLDIRDTPDNPTYNPLRVVPVDILALVRDQESPPGARRKAEPRQPAEAVELPGDATLNVEGLEGQPYDRLRREIEQAASLGLPILLEGERGTGKTSLAEFYHQRRQFYRRQRGERDQAEVAASERGPKLGPRGRVRFPNPAAPHQFVVVSLSEFADLETLRDTLFGWARGSWTGAEEAYDGLLGEAHQGTLFLDEIHHLDRRLQPLLLGPLNTDSLNRRRYKPKMAVYEILSDFDLVVATNDPHWRSKLIPDLLERFERIVLQVPSFRSFQKECSQTIWQFWEYTLKWRCEKCGIEYTEEGNWNACCQMLLHLFQTNPLHGNWRALQRLADNVLLCLTDARDGRPTALEWSVPLLKEAISRTFVDAEFG